MPPCLHPFIPSEWELCSRTAMTELAHHAPCRISTKGDMAHVILHMRHAIDAVIRNTLFIIRCVLCVMYDVCIIYSTSGV